MSLAMANLLDAIPEELGEELFTELLASEHVRIERIVSRGHSSPASGWYDQDDNEWVLVLQGEAIVSFRGGGDEHLVAGSYLNIPAHAQHKVTWTTPDTDTVWLAIHYR